MHRPPWPVAPRPFSDEAFGSWLGRVASRYGIGVDELVQAADVELDLGVGAWLAIPAPDQRTAEHLAALCRMAPDEFTRMTSSTSETGSRFPYCFECLVMNTQDVTAPYWKTQWLAAEASVCTFHPQRDNCVTVETLRSERNMRRLVQYISRNRRRSLRKRTAPYISLLCERASWVRGPR